MRRKLLFVFLAVILANNTASIEFFLVYPTERSSARLRRDKRSMFGNPFY
jgi:hypothetical protein